MFMILGFLGFSVFRILFFCFRVWGLGCLGFRFFRV